MTKIWLREVDMQNRAVGYAAAWNSMLLRTKEPMSSIWPCSCVGVGSQIQNYLIFAHLSPNLREDHNMIILGQ